MNPQPVSLADELRKLEEKWEHDTIIDGPHGKQYEKHSADCRRCELSALLAQHAVAGPPQVWPNTQANAYPYGWRWMRLRGYLKEWLTPHQYDLAKGYLETALIASPAHAAEQPKLTEEQVALIMYDDWQPDTWKRIVVSLEKEPWKGGKHSGDCTRTAHTCNRCLVEEIQATTRRVNDLLTSPVAPPPPCGKDWFCSQPGCDKLHSEHRAGTE